MAWISKLVEKGVYSVGDTIIVHLDEIKDLKKGTTKNGCFTDKAGQKVNINLKPTDSLEVGMSYEYHIDHVNGTFVNGSFAPVGLGVSVQDTLADYVPDYTCETQRNRAYEVLIERRNNIEQELGALNYVLEHWEELL